MFRALALHTVDYYIFLRIEDCSLAVDSRKLAPFKSKPENVSIYINSNCGRLAIIIILDVFHLPPCLDSRARQHYRFRTLVSKKIWSQLTRLTAMGCGASKNISPQKQDATTGKPNFFRILVDYSGQGYTENTTIKFFSNLFLFIVLYWTEYNSVNYGSGNQTKWITYSFWKWMDFTCDGQNMRFCDRFWFEICTGPASYVLDARNKNLKCKRRLKMSEFSFILFDDYRACIENVYMKYVHILNCELMNE